MITTVQVFWNPVQVGKSQKVFRVNLEREHILGIKSKTFMMPQEVPQGPVEKIGAPQPMP